MGLGLVLGLWLALGLGLGLGSVSTFKRPDRFCRRTKFNVTGGLWLNYTGQLLDIEFEFTLFISQASANP